MGLIYLLALCMTVQEGFAISLVCDCKGSNKGMFLYIINCHEEICGGKCVWTSDNSTCLDIYIYYSDCMLLKID